MKSTLLALVVTLATTFGFEGRSFAQLSGGDSFIVSNQQSQSLGAMTITAPSDIFYATVTGMSTDTIAISDTVVLSITINNQVVPQGVKAIVTLPGDKQVAVLWPVPNEILVIDESQL